MYVDDIVVAGSDLAEVEIAKADFKKRFEMRDLAELRHYLGMTTERDCRKVSKFIRQTTPGNWSRSIRGT